jgi:peptide/nickel transport system permease protein
VSAALPEVADVARPGRLRRLAALLDPRAGPARWPILIALATILAWVVVGVTIDLWTPYDPVALAGRRLQPPSASHWLGTDALGRDVLVRTLYGVRYSLPVAVGVLVTAVAIGCCLGALAGFFGGLLDGALMRLADVTLSFPAMLLAMAIAASLGPGLFNAGLAMVIVWWPIYARLMRAQVLAVRSLEHVDAAVAMGASRPRILVRHILPLCWTPILVNATVDVSQIVLLVAGLSFIGLGARPPTPEWGQMIAEGATNFYNWWIAAGPGLAILSLSLAFSFIGDGLRDLLDPRSR